jgi:hypothetical protein
MRKCNLNTKEMKNTDRTERKIDQTLKVLDDLQRAEPKPFFYTRLQARMQKQTGAEVLPRWVMKPALICSGLVVIVLLNLGMAINYSKKASRNEQNAGSFAEEYGLTIDGLDSN